MNLTNLIPHALKCTLLATLLFCIQVTSVLAQSTTPPPVNFTDAQALEIMTKAKALENEKQGRHAGMLYYQVAQSNSKYFGEAAYLLGVQFMDMGKYENAEKSFNRAMLGNYAPAKDKLLELQALIMAGSEVDNEFLDKVLDKPI